MLTSPILYQFFLLTSTLSFKSIEPKHYYYLRGTNVVFDDGSSAYENITLFPYVIIDLLRECYVHGVFFQFRNEYDTSDGIWMKCFGMTTHSVDAQECENNDMVGRTILFICECSTRFIGVETEVPFDVAYINVTGSEMFSAFYAGCYESSLTDGGYLVEELSECIFECLRLGYSLAGVKMRFCYCFNGFDGTIVSNNMCVVQCLELQLCGSERHIMLYFTDYFSLVEQRINLTTADCVFYKEHCKVCPAGRIGFNCDITDCNNANGNCGDRQCDPFADDPMIGGFCRCTPGFQMSDRWNCSDIDECDRGFSECSGNLTCKNTIGTYICTCNIGYSHVEENCEDIDECASGFSVCGGNGTCNNTFGTYICMCRIGYSYVESGCKDIDECLEGHEICGDNKDCINSDGSYFCDCAEGFAEENDECIELSNISFREKRITRILSLSYLAALALVTIPITVFALVRKVCKRKLTETGSRTSSRPF